MSQPEQRIEAPVWALDLAARVMRFEEEHPKIDDCLADAVAAIPREVVERVIALAEYRASPQFRDDLAAAWDAGFTACAEEHITQRRDPTHAIHRINPYCPVGMR